ncbi:DUF4270 family protein [Lewinella sp. W8]|uniref:DUF4270 family protein n=1 Tax=Lewinella sp. W8 TaxID=2528208 RepID=UPI0010688411|nr:DUF4270 family protein [Lewinella sp. W8]MTB52616.1 DUF4270 family protein [Lewinella sp. W8]
MKQFIFLALVALTFVIPSCTEPITVGSDILNVDRAELGQTMDLEFTTKVVRDDTILTFDASVNAAIAGFTFGTLEDDVFGSVKHGAYLIPNLSRNSSGFARIPPFAFTDEMVDSVVLIIPIDTANAFYGNTREFNFRLGRLASPVDQEQDYYSNVSFPRGFEDLNRESSFFATKTPRLLYDTLVASNGDSVLGSHIRIPFTDQFVTQLNLQDTATFESDSAFWSFLAGFYLEPDGNTDGLLTLEPQPTRQGATPFGGLYLFYPDTANQEPTFYRAPLFLWLPRYEKNYTGSLAGSLLGPDQDNEQVLLSGQAGLMTEITFTDLSALEDVVINQAEISFTVEEVSGYSTEDRPIPTFVALYYRNEEGVITPIDDRVRLGNPFSSDIIRQFLGGEDLLDSDGDSFYRPRFSVHMQRMVSGEVPPTIYMRVVPVDIDPSRVILGGPESSVKPATVRVTFTELD